MTRLMLTFVAVLFSTPVCLAEPPKDLFGKSLPHGKTIDGSYFGITLTRTNLYIGQPLLVKVFSDSATEGEDLLLSFGVDRIFDFELRDEAGKLVRCEWDSNYPYYEGDLVALKPPPTYAHGQHWKPGKYSLRAKLTIKEEITQPHLPVGTFSSNELTFTIHPPGHPLETTVPQFRKDLKKEECREDFWIFVSGLDDKVSRKLCRELNYESKLWQLHVAMNGPIHVPQNRNLTERENESLLRDLESDSPSRRLLAVRSVPQNANPEVIGALINLLGDDHSIDDFRSFGFGGAPIPIFPIQDRAWEEIGKHGPSIIDPLCEYLLHYENEKHEQYFVVHELIPKVIRLFGQMEYSKKAELCLRFAAAYGDPKWIELILDSIPHWGSRALPLTRTLLQHEYLNEQSRRTGIQTLSQFGDPRVDTPFLMSLLKSGESPADEAIRALVKWKRVEALPECYRHLTYPGIKEDLRYAAIDGILALEQEKAANRYLLKVIDSQDKTLVQFAMLRAGERRLDDARPLALKRLSDDDPHVREAADHCLRALANHRKGVGYDSLTQDSKLWIEYFEKLKK